MSVGNTDKNDISQYGWVPKTMPRIRETMAQEIIQRGAGATEEDLRSASPVKIDWPDEEAGWRMLGALYASKDLLFIGVHEAGGSVGGAVRRVSDCVEVLKRDGGAFSHFIPNPMSGVRDTAEDGTVTMCSRDCVESHRFATIELAAVPLDRQIAFWRALPHLPIAAITHTGGKTLEVLVRVDAEDADEWECEVAKRLFDQFLLPLGVPAHCKNMTRLACLPGGRRADTGVQNRLLYLAPEGKAVMNAS